jgi:hypothetical protein
MMQRRKWLLLAAACLCLSSRAPAIPVMEGAPARSQAPERRRSHHSIVNNIDQYTVEDQLIERLRKAIDGDRKRDVEALFGNKDLLRELTKGKLTAEQLQFLDANSDKIAALLRDERFRELLDESMAAKKGGQALGDIQIDTLKRLADSKLDPASLPADGGTRGDQRTKSESASDSPRELRRAQAFDPNEEGSSAPPEEQLNWFERQMGRIVDSAVAEMNNPANAGAFQDAIRALGGIKDDAEGGQHFDFAGLWRGASSDAANWMASRWYWPQALVDAPKEFYRDFRDALPEIGSSVNGVLANAPTRQLPSASVGVPVETIAWCVLAAVTAAIVWQSVGKKVAARVKGVDAKLGPWPVDPGAVASRDDVVHAFEYLALLRLGIGARTANHLAVAARLGAAESDAARRGAAAELARLYERARYEPGIVSLDESQIAAARRDLKLLARAAAA